MKKIKIFYLLTIFSFVSVIFLLVYYNNYITIAKNKFFHTKEDQIKCHDASSKVIYEDLGYKWEKITCASEFSPRDGAGALVFKDSLRLIGGWNPLDKNNFPLICNNEVWSSSNGFIWNRTKKNTFTNKNFDKISDWEGRHTAGYVVFKKKMWIIGGDLNQGHFQFDVWNSSNGKKWDHINLNSPVPWGPRVLHYTTVFKNKIWIMGGQTIPQFAKSEEKFYNDVWNTKDGIKWIQISDNNPWKPRGMIGGSVVFQEKMWIIGGGIYDTPSTPKRKFYNDIWNTKDGINWSLISKNAPWEARQYHDITVWDNKLWIIGGVNKQLKNLNDVWFSENGLNWIELPNTPWRERHAASIFVFKNSLWVVAGNNMENDVWKLSKIN
jgi:hypothetical protein